MKKCRIIYPIGHSRETAGPYIAPGKGDIVALTGGEMTHSTQPSSVGAKQIVNTRMEFMGMCGANVRWLRAAMRLLPPATNGSPAYGGWIALPRKIFDNNIITSNLK